MHHHQLHGPDQLPEHGCTRSRRSESIELSAGLFGAAGELAKYFLLSSLTVSQNGSAPLIVPEAPCVWIKGKAVLFPGGPAPNIEYAVEISAACRGPRSFWC